MNFVCVVFSKLCHMENAFCPAASERIVHLRTPKETTVEKIMESCIKMMGMTDDKSLFTLKEKKGA